MTETIIITLGHGPSLDDPNGPGQDDATAAAFVRNVSALVTAVWGEVQASVTGMSSSSWGEEPATWLSASWDDDAPVQASLLLDGAPFPGTLRLLRLGLGALATEYGQSAIGLVVAGEYYEVPAL